MDTHSAREKPDGRKTEDSKSQMSQKLDKNFPLISRKSFLEMLIRVAHKVESETSQ